jgi:hypothetical protein
VLWVWNVFREIPFDGLAFGWCDVDVDVDVNINVKIMKLRIFSLHHTLIDESTNQITAESIINRLPTQPLVLHYTLTVHAVSPHHTQAGKSTEAYIYLAPFHSSPRSKQRTIVGET